MHETTYIEHKPQLRRQASGGLLSFMQVAHLQFLQCCHHLLPYALQSAHFIQQQPINWRSHRDATSAAEFLFTDWLTVGNQEEVEEEEWDREGTRCDGVVSLAEVRS